jgi:hypothetical protein
MTSRVIVPFDNNPTSTSIKTTAYTVPAGKYARVQNLHGDLTINTVPHYVVISSFSRILTTTSAGVKNTIFCDDRIDFVKCTRSSTISNSSNFTSSGYYIGGIYVPFDFNISFTETSSTYGSSTGGAYYEESYTGTKISYIPMPKFLQQIPYTTGSTGQTYNTSNTSVFGLNFSTARASGTVTHEVTAATYDKNEFWVASGTVLDGIKYLITEYNIVS